MKTIWKYPIEVGEGFECEMPEGAEILTAQVQYDKPYLWALVDPARPPQKRRFAFVGTGDKREDLDGARYVGTFQLLSGELIFHIFALP